MVEGGVGVLRRADGHDGEVKVFDGVGSDRRGYWIFLPRIVRLANQDPSSDEPKTYNSNPENLCSLCLQKKAYSKNKEHQTNLTLAVEMYVRP